MGPYAQPLYFQPAMFTPELSGNLSNLAFAYTNGTPITSGIESGADNVSASSLVWLRPGAFAPGATVNVEALAYPRLTFLLSPTGLTGEAPELSAGYSQLGYARWDDGALVVPFYANFKGTQLPSGGNASPGLASAQSNGLHVTQEVGNDGGLNTSRTFGPGAWFDRYSDCRVAIFEDSRTTPRSVGGRSCISGSCGTTPYFQQNEIENATWSVGWEPGYANFTRNCSTEQSVSVGVPAVHMSLHLGTTANDGLTTSDDAYVSWVREQPALPGDRFPAVVTLPGAPSAPTATVVGASQVHLAWVNPSGTTLENTSIEISNGCTGTGSEISANGVIPGWLLGSLTAHITSCARVTA